MSYPTLYRRRIIPEECIPLTADKILTWNETHIITSWNALHPKPELHHGLSCYFLKDGFKVSKFCREDDSLLYWYCDIVDFNYHASDNSLIVTDLLADVIIYPDGFVKVVDLDELVSALESRSISLDTLKSSLMRLNKLLEIIYSGRFDELKAYLPQP